MPVAAPLSLREGDRARLEALARSTSARASVAHRARIVLMSAAGLTNTEIARLTGSSRPTVINWRNRYAAGGISALGDLPRSGRPAVVDELEVVATTLADGGRPPEHLGVDHWSSRLLGKQLGISFATVARIWRKWGIRPHRVETFTLAAHPTLDAQAREVTSHTHQELRQQSSRVVESSPVRGSDRSVGRSRDSMPVRAEFHGARGRRSGPRKRVSG